MSVVEIELSETTAKAQKIPPPGGGGIWVNQTTLFTSAIQNRRDDGRRLVKRHALLGRTPIAGNIVCNRVLAIRVNKIFNLNALIVSLRTDNHIKFPASNCLAVAAPLPPRGILYILPPFLKISCAAVPKAAAKTAAIETAHILRLFYLCCLCQCGQQSASRMDFSVYRPILQAGNFCAILHFLCPLSPARLQGRSLCEHTANSGAKVWYTARFCAILDKKSIQPGRARHKRGNT